MGVQILWIITHYGIYSGFTINNLVNEADENYHLRYYRIVPSFLRDVSIR